MEDPSQQYVSPDVARAARGDVVVYDRTLPLFEQASPEIVEEIVRPIVVLIGEGVN